MRSLKLVCVVLFVAFLASVCLISKPFVREVGTFSGGPPAGYTGAPGESDCAQCHANNPGPGQFSIIAPSAYVPGQTYQVVVRHTTIDPTRRRWGFELTALAGTDPAGTFRNLDPNTQPLPGLVRRYIVHTAPGTFQGQTGGAQWAFTWTAPPDDIGTITFYAAGNQADNSGTVDGDQIYYALFEAQPSLATPTPTPSPSPTPQIFYSLTGRVLSPDGRGLRSSTVTLTNSMGERRSTLSSSFGVFLFENVPAGNSYVLGVVSKRYRFTPRTFNVTGNQTNIDFLGLE